MSLKYIMKRTKQKANKQKTRPNLPLQYELPFVELPVWVLSKLVLFWLMDLHNTIEMTLKIFAPLLQVTVTRVAEWNQRYNYVPYLHQSYLFLFHPSVLWQTQALQWSKQSHKMNSIWFIIRILCHQVKGVKNNHKIPHVNKPVIMTWWGQLLPQSLACNVL